MNQLKSSAIMPERQPISDDVTQYIERVANRAQQLSERASVKLQGVMTQACPRPSCVGTGKADAEYPPLFLLMRTGLNTINDALDSIEDALNRTEL